MKITKYTRKCPKCDKDLYYKYKSVLEKAISAGTMCLKCTLTVRNQTLINSKKENNSQWKGYKEIPFNWFSQYFLRSNNGKTGNVVIEQIYDLWNKQNRRCALTNIEIGFYDDREKYHTCSIDRIDSSKQYEINNIQLVHKDINKMKNAYSQKYFIDMCKKVAENYEL